MRKFASIAISLAVGSLFVAACGGSKHLTHTVEPTSVSILSPEERAPVDQAELEVTQAQNAVNAAQQQLAQSQRDRDIAHAEVKKAKADLAIEETNLKSANEGHQADEMLQAKQRRDKADATLTYSKLESKHQDCEVTLAERKLDEANAWLLHAQAEVELAKAKAIQTKTNDTSPEGQERLANFETQAAKLNHAHARARQDTAAAQKKCDDARTAATAAKSAIPGTTDVVAPPPPAATPVPSPQPAGAGQ